MKKVEFLIKRGSFDELTFARVTAELNAQAEAHGLADERKFRKALIAGISQWVKDIPAGRDAWKQSKQDFNVGDLALVLPDADLRRILDDIGIFELEIETTSAEGFCAHWVYDTVLVDETVLEDADGADRDGGAPDPGAAGA